MTAKPCKVVTDWLLRATDLEKMNLLTFLFISTHISIGLLSPGSNAEAAVG